MSTNTAATQIHEAFKARGPQVAAPPPVALEHVNRYVWFPAEDIPYTEANAGYVALLRERAKQLGMYDVPLAGGYVERMRVTPILAAPHWDRIGDVPETMRRDHRGLKPNGDYEEAQYFVPPGHIFDGLMDSYRFWGVTELTALRGMDIEDFLELRIDDMFFPEPKDLTRLGSNLKPIDETPRKYSLMRSQIMTVLATQPRDARFPIYESVGREMLFAIDVASAFDTQLVDEEESRNPLKYSHHGLRALHRLERTRRDHAMNEMAKRQDQAMDAVQTLPEMVKAMSANAGGGITAEALDKILSSQAEKYDAMLAAADARYASLLEKFAAAQSAPTAELKPEPKQPTAKK